MKRRVVITGLGTVNPLGHTAAATWARVRAGESGIEPLTRFDASELRTGFGGEVRGFDASALFGRKEARRMDPVTQYALAAATWALEDAGIAPEAIDRDAAGVVLGCGMGNMTTILDGAESARQKGLNRVNPFYVPMLLADAPAATISITHGLRGPNMAIATACAAGNNAIGEATRMVQRGAADVMLAGGAEAPLLPLVLAGFAATGALSTYEGDPRGACRPFDLDRDGFVVSEGAAVLVLEALEHAQARGARVYGEVLGYGTSADAHHVSAPLEDGAGAAAAMRLALADADLGPEDISYVNAHGTGTQLNDRSETTAIKRVFGEHAYRLPISSTKSIHGHLLGAAGALEALICVMALDAGAIPPTINYTTPDPTCDLDYVTAGARPAALRYVMSNGFGLGGHNATIILGAFERSAV
jgi:3-oxoacyl-[acyl-carrier-protein] synthase II